MEMELIEFLAYLMLTLGFYLLPSLIAAFRNHTSGGGILVINVLLGWTILGWIIALAWSVSGFHPPPTKS